MLGRHGRSACQLHVVRPERAQIRSAEQVVAGCGARHGDSPGIAREIPGLGIDVVHKDGIGGRTFTQKVGDWELGIAHDPVVPGLHGIAELIPRTAYAPRPVTIRTARSGELLTQAIGVSEALWCDRHPLRFAHLGQRTKRGEQQTAISGRVRQRETQALQVDFDEQVRSPQSAQPIV